MLVLLLWAAHILAKALMDYCIIQWVPTDLLVTYLMSKCVADRVPCILGHLYANEIF